MSSKKQKPRTEKRVVKRRINCDLSDPELNRKPKEGCGFIYMYTFRNGKRYIGQTRYTVKKRLLSHVSKTMIVDKVIRSGASFKVDILSEPKLEFLNDAEDYCINRFNALIPNGYNQLVGNHNAPMLDPDVAKRVGASFKMYIESHPDYRIKLSRRMKETHKRYPDGTSPCFMKRKIICLETKKVYDSITKAAEDMKCTNAQISCALRFKKNAHTAGGCHWFPYDVQYLEDSDMILQIIKDYEAQCKDQRFERRTRTYGVKILCKETGIIYDTIKSVCECMDISKSYLIRYLNGTAKAVKGYHFEKVE